MKQNEPKTKLADHLHNVFVDEERISKNERYLCIAITVTLAFLVGLFCYLNIFHILDYAHSDFSNSILMKQQMWETKSLIPPNWWQGSELNYISIWWFYVPVYAITGNFMLSQQISIICQIFLQLSVLWFFLRQLNVRLSAILFVLCCYFGINVNSGFLFVAFDAYVCYTVYILFSLGLILSLENHWTDFKSIWELKSILKILILLFIAVYIGYASPKLNLMLYLPFLFVELVLYFKKYGLKERIVLNKEVYSIVLILLMLTLSMVAYSVMTKTNINYVPTPIEMSPLSKILDPANISVQLQSLLYAMNLFFSSSIVSKAGILFILSVSFILFFIGSLIYSLKYSKKQSYQKISLYFIFATMLMVGYLTVSVKEVTPRYLFATTTAIYIIIGLAINDAIARKIWWMKFLAVTMLVTVILGRIIQPTDFVIPMDPQKNVERKEIANYMVDNGYETVTGNYWNVDVLTAYSNGKIRAMHYDGKSYLVPFMVLTDKSYYVDDKKSNPNILLITDTEEADMKANEKMQKILSEGEKIKEIGEYNLYKYTRNLMHLIQFPSMPGESTSYSFGQLPDSFMVNMKVDPNIKSGTIGPASGYFFGPYTTVTAGTYDIVLNYRIIQAFSNEKVGSIYVSSGVANKKFAEAQITRDAESITLSNVKFDKNTIQVEIVGICDEGNIIEFKNIGITKRF